MIEPDPKQGPGEPGPKGSLMVETARTGINQGQFAQRYRVILYDEKGALLDDVPNDFVSSIGLPAGRYVVVSQMHFGYRRVQVVVRPGLQTVVTLKDLESAPDSD